MTITSQRTIQTRLSRDLRGGVDLRSRDLQRNLRGSKTTLAQLRKFDSSGAGGNNNGVLEGPELKKALADANKRGVDWKRFSSALKSGQGVAVQRGTASGDPKTIAAEKKRIAKLKKDVEHMRTQEQYYCAPKKDFNGYSCGAAEKMREDAEVDLHRARKDLDFWKRPMQRHTVYYRNGNKEVRYYSTQQEGNRFLRARMFNKKGKLLRDYTPPRLSDKDGSISYTHQNGQRIRIVRNSAGEALTRAVRDKHGRTTRFRFYPGSPSQRGIPMHRTKPMSK